MNNRWSRNYLVGFYKKSSTSCQPQMSWHPTELLQKAEDNYTNNQSELSVSGSSGRNRRERIMTSHNRSLSPQTVIVRQSAVLPPRVTVRSHHNYDVRQQYGRCQRVSDVFPVTCGTKSPLTSKPRDTARRAWVIFLIVCRFIYHHAFVGRGVKTHLNTLRAFILRGVKTHLDTLRTNVFFAVLLHPPPPLQSNPDAVSVEPLLALVARYHEPVQILIISSRLHGRSQGAQGAMPPSNFCHILWFCVFRGDIQTKYCCSTKIKNFWPRQNWTITLILPHFLTSHQVEKKYLWVERLSRY